jgi:molecular chaperone HtpG
MVADDWRAETQTRLAQSGLYVALRAKCQQDAAGAAAIALVDSATFYAFQRTKSILRHMGEFTLHDGDHLFRVLTLMERLLTAEQIKALSVPELMLLILSAFFHDIGMAADEKEVLSWRKFWDSTPEYLDSEDEARFSAFARFAAARPDHVGRINQLVEQGRITDADLAKNYLITEHIRLTHANRAREIIERDWNEKIRYRDVDLTIEFAAICFSHNEDAATVLQLDSNYLCGPDVFACLPLIAEILRLADILDFDAKRTPEILFSHLFVRHPISLREWNKHRAVEAWSIDSKRIQFHAKCGHPAIQAAIHAFCNAIDAELSTANNVFSSLNDMHRSQGRDLQFRVPLKVDRQRIETKKAIDGRPQFLYRETQFNLSKRQVVDLLMGTSLYGNPEVALRELLQNSIDACLLRQALERSWKNLYEPQICVRYFSENGEDVLEVTDNGIGMDQHVIDAYYSKIGSSFYKSSEFFDLKSKSKADFVPTSRFGIGILSCFMVADTLVVDTRKVYAPHSSSEPISLTIEGQESIFWTRPGSRDTPGTTTKLVLRKSANPWERMTEEEFIKSVETVLPNPPFSISIESRSTSRTRNEESFRLLLASSLKDYSWDDHKNIKQVEVDFHDKAAGLVGSAVVAILQRRGKPVSEVEMLSKSINVDGETYKLSKALKLSGKEISLHSTSIAIDEDGNIDPSDSRSRLCNSASRVSLHGIEVPTTVFPESWAAKANQAALNWPLPLLLVVDVCSSGDLDLNSSRTQILLSEKWQHFEEKLCRTIFSKVATTVGTAYWGKLRPILLANAKSETFKSALSTI